MARYESRRKGEGALTASPDALERTTGGLDASARLRRAQARGVTEVRRWRRSLKLRADRSADSKRLRRRRSAKWVRYNADVLPAWWLRMDFPLAEARQAGPYRGGPAGRLRLCLAARSRSWQRPSPTSPRVVLLERRRGSGLPSSDVVGAIRRCSGCSRNRARVVINTPVYPPFFAVIEELGCEPAEARLAPEGLRSKSNRAGSSPPGPSPCFVQPAQSDRRHVPTREQAGSR